MAPGPRVVAELGRPETPEETAARKAESSRVYRSSQTFRNLVAALIVTVAVVAIVYFGVPRGTPPETEPVDVAAAAAEAQASSGEAIIVPEVPDAWRANSAGIKNGAWHVVYAPPKGFVRIAQGFSVSETWVSNLLGGRAPTDATTIDGIEWDVYALNGDKGLTYALATAAGADTVVVYGSTTQQTGEIVADALADQIRDLRKDAP